MLNHMEPLVSSSYKFEEEGGKEGGRRRKNPRLNPTSATGRAKHALMISENADGIDPPIGNLVLRRPHAYM